MYSLETPYSLMTIIQDSTHQMTIGDGQYVLVSGLAQTENSEDGTRLCQQCELSELQL